MTADGVATGDDLAIGVDVGGTKCLALVLRGDTVIDESRRETPSADRLADHLIDMVSAIEERLGCRVPVLGVGAPGLVTPDGVVRASPNLRDAADVALGKRLRDVGRWRVHVENDATAAAYAEWATGVARGSRHVMMVTLGTGIGGGYVVDGKVHRGANGFAGEIGHMVIVANGTPCPCGKRGCWERYASGSALRQFSGGEDGEVVARRAARGDSDSLSVMQTFADWVALGLANLVNAFDPEVIVLGGGVVESADMFLPIVKDRLREHLYSSEQRPCPDVVAAKHGERSGAIGAALLGRLH